MTKVKLCCISFWLSLYSTVSFGQNNVSGYEVDLQEKTPQSPNAGNLGKYFDIPVNMASGIPNISIPLYTIKAGNIVVPIALSYHGGGIRVDDIGSWVGLGWSLNAGGSVVKKTNGLDDYYQRFANGPTGNPEQSYTSPDYANIAYSRGNTNMTDAINDLINNASYSALDSIDHFFSWVAKGYLDAEADEFDYSMSGGSGKFYYNQKKAKFQTSKIDGSIVTGDGSGWYITTNDGKVYEFGGVERTVNPAYLKNLSSQQYLISASYLTNINDPVTGKDVHFAYNNYYKSNVPMGIYEVRDYEAYLFAGYPVLYADNYDDNFRTGDNLVLSAISFDKGIIYFINDTTTRPDYGPNALKEIQIFNNSNILIKKFNLEYFYNSNRLFLKSLQETNYENGDTLTLPAYKFNYDTAINLPARLSYAQDKWGYYNGKTSNWTGIPSHPLASQYSTLVMADRSVDSNYAKAGMLNSIVYPTGGKTVFEFECNRIVMDSLVGGLRIRKIAHIDSATQKNIVTEYRYLTPSGYSSGAIDAMPVFNYDLLHVSGDVYHWYFYNIMRTESTPVNSLFPNQGSPILYSRVEKREKSVNGDLLSLHYFQPYYEAGEIYTNRISVPHKKELEINDILETATEIYKKDDDTSYSLIQKESSEFNMLASTQNAVWNAQAAWVFNNDEYFSEWPGGDPVTLYPMAAWFAPSLNAYKIMPCANVKTAGYSSSYANGNTLTVPSFYEYDSTNGNLKISKTVDSRGDTTIKMIKYACDYISTSSPDVNFQIQSLNNFNMIASPVEIITLFKRKDSSNATVQSAELYEYDSLKVKKVYRMYDQVPYNSFTVSYNDSSGFYRDSHYQLYQEVKAYDEEGRPRTVVTNTNWTSYTWDEKYSQPTSIVANASYEDIAYTSFEGQSNGSWTVASSNRDSTYHITGKKCYQLSNGNISKAGLNSGLNYIVSYWSRNGSSSSFTVSGSLSVKEGRTVNGWTYYEHLVNATTVNVSGTGYIDELRLYPINSLMSTYTYEPLIGITSQCDVNNRIVYYSYNAFGQLVLIRDQDSNIVKKFCYNYAGQPENCGINCTDTAADWQNTSTALRCQLDSTGQNTGYKEQEQRDMNPCSPAFYRVKWVVTGADTTTCPLPVYVNLTSTNIGNTTGFTASYYNTTTGYTYNFSVSAASGLQSLGTIPSGNYTLTISGASGNYFGTFGSGCSNQTMSGNSATFYNVSVSTSTCNSISWEIDPGQ